MNAIELLPFQSAASKEIFDRFTQLIADPKRPLVHRGWDVPYYQALSALTGAGKTPILADAVSLIRAGMSAEPLVLWISKAKAVVEQTLANFQPAGKYAHLLDGFMAMSVNDLKDEAIKDISTPLIVLATVGTFNREAREQSALRIFKKQSDDADDSLWNLLKTRPLTAKGRRPLIIVYDEAQNLSDQQTDLLLELEPDVVLAASATMRTPAKLTRLLDRLRDAEWNDDRLVTPIKSKDVVDWGLVKQQIVLGGYATTMEAAIDDLLKQMKLTAQKAKQHRAGFAPKAIYVCRTNVSQEDGTKDNPARPFSQRKAPPILIWRYLVEKKGVNPKDIAVYCDLKFDRKHNPPPEEFVHFSGGEDDFGTFTAGNYRHVIFNLGLQEGWDDPECCFAYIDKSMGSRIAVTQIIGRVLRQPGAKRFSDPDLNTANFYIRIDSKSVFPEILNQVRKEIGAENPNLKIEGFSDSRDRQRMRAEPKQQATVPEVHINLDEAIKYDSTGRAYGPFIDALDNIIDYRKNAGKNVVGKGELVRAVQAVGDAAKPETQSITVPHSNRVMARWIIRREIQSLYPRVLQSIDSMIPKFDAKIELTSPAANQLKQAAAELVSVYLEHADLAYEDSNPYTVGPVLLNPKKQDKFKNAIHEAYSDLNQLELAFARAIDETGYTWCRNPSNGGYAIALLQTGDAHNFYPDFLVWKNDVVYALDPKGGHLIAKDAGLKLLNIRDDKGKQKVTVRLFTEGKWTDPHKKKSPGGFSVWSIRIGKPHSRHFDSVEEAVAAALK